MNAEELKLIMDALAQMGEQGKDAFIAYLFIVYGTALFKHFLWASVFLSGIVILYKTLKNAINKAR